MAISASPAMAQREWRWNYEDRWEHRAELQRHYRDLEDARRQLDYDLRHGASRWRIADDEARIREIERNIRTEERYARWYR
jgi:hypothetical protein